MVVESPARTIQTGMNKTYRETLAHKWTSLNHDNLNVNQLSCKIRTQGLPQYNPDSLVVGNLMRNWKHVDNVVNMSEQRDLSSLKQRICTCRFKRTISHHSLDLTRLNTRLLSHHLSVLDQRSERAQRNAFWEDTEAELLKMQKFINLLV